jgi:cell wall-associated NlpC family hydrolase
LVRIYKQGHTGGLDVLLSAKSFSDLVNRLDQLSRISRQDSQVLNEVKTYWARVADRQANLAAQLKHQKAYAVQTTTAKQKVQEQLALQKRLLKGKEAQIAQLKKAEAARQAKLVAAAKAAAHAAAASVSGGSGSPGSTSTRGSSGGSDPGTTTVPSSPTGSKVVDLAVQYVGVPYVWAGSSPGGFDCSGLVMYVYAKVRISLPHSSRMQYGYGTSVSRDQLQAGDLLFFYNPIHHVAIYIGNGQMVNARGSRVQIDEVWTNSYYGAKRIL